MIYSLKGTLIEAAPGMAVIECGGVGYLLGMPAGAVGALPPAGQVATVYTHLTVSENDVALYGFTDPAQRQMFLLLTAVSGVGPKAGLAILSALSPQQVTLAVSAGDFKAFTAAQGIGQKLAQRLVLELKDKLAKSFGTGGLSMADIAAAAGTASAAQGAPQQAVAALVALGYSQSEAAAAVAPIEQGLPVSEMVRLALKGMNRS